ncbi:MAG: NapC/NirT family cytochrome c [Thermoanaerobaculia bacterium]
MNDQPTMPSLFRNIISVIGALIAIVSLLNILFLVFAGMGSGESSPYIGILAWMILPGIMVFGIALSMLGAVLERRRRRKMAPGEIPEFPRIDLNLARHRRIFAMSVIGGLLFVCVSLIGSYQAYHYTDTDEFCGLLCHSVMHPEYIAYKASPHARVGCVDCHVGAGAGWYVRSKLSGAYQVYSTAFNKYPKPIDTPVENLRPAQQTCETCHWPEKFWGAQLKTFNHFGYDEANTPRETQMLIKTGGGSPSTGLTAGIHWHMNIANEITYVAEDRQRQVIPWVRMKNREGQVTEFWLKDSKVKPEQVNTMEQRRMDCIDCHNRPTHIYVPPDRSVDRALLAGNIDPKLPFAKLQAVEALTQEYASTTAAVAGIAKRMTDYYQTTYPDLYASQKPAIDKAIASTQDIYRTTIFPEMKVDWRTHPDNVGHFYFAGCFRCHDDQHVSKDGKVISKDCNICHTVISQKESGNIMASAPQADFQHPVDLGDLREFACTDCHTGGPQS